MVASGPDVEGDPLFESLLSLVFFARERIWILTPYFVPDEMLVRGLALAARRGVDVRLIVPWKSNHPITDLAREGYLRELYEAGASVMLYRPTMLHAKAVIFDDKLVVIGSPNMDNRSLFLNYEVALYVFSTESVAEVARWAERLMAGSTVYMPKRGDEPRDRRERLATRLTPALIEFVDRRRSIPSGLGHEIANALAVLFVDIGRASLVKRTFSSGGARNVVAMTIRVTPPNMPASKTPGSGPSGRRSGRPRPVGSSRRRSPVCHRGTRTAA